MQQHALVSGASIAGLSMAWWLARTGWRVTVLERSSAFRDGGQNVDVRGVAKEVLDRMGLVEQVRARNTTETGTVLVEEDGSVRVELPDGGGAGATAELEVLRGDLARVLLDALPSDVVVRYGETIADVTDDGQGITARTDGGSELTADLLVVAEGVRSSTRALVFTDDEVEARDLGVAMVFGTIPRDPSDDDRWRWYNAVEGRQVHLRPDPYGTTRAILACTNDDDLAAYPRDAALARMRERYRDAGWQTERVLDGFDASDDVYVDQLTQIRMPRWSRGRVVLAGDAAWCVTPMGGGGASLALTAGYVLAATLDAHDGTEAAVDAFEEWMRPLVTDVQDIPKGIVRFAYPQTRLGLAARSIVDRAIGTKVFAPIAARLTQVAETERPLPPLRTTA
ncbi:MULTISPECIES: FAD-dependent monooxygenase [Curtobacterium]|uniref:FAD-dependent monooxygenase n=1 Tax=Curtobacterium flaccumfaciens TaxID=2035 RepID=UPI003EE4773E